MAEAGERVYIAKALKSSVMWKSATTPSIWYNCVVRGDVDIVRIGQHTNIQDGSIGHVMKNECPLILRDYVTIGHGVMLHGCTIESHCLIGMRATLLNNVVIGEYSIVGAGAFVTEGTKIPPRSLVYGLPAEVKRPLTDEEAAGMPPANSYDTGDGLNTAGSRWLRTLHVARNVKSRRS